MKIRIGSTTYSSKSYDSKIAKLCWYGTDCNTVMDRVCALLLVLSPLLQHYVGLYKNAGFTVYLLVLPWLLLRMISSSKNQRILSKRIVAIVPLIMYQIYAMFNHGTSISKILYNGFMIVLFTAIVLGYINISYILKYAIYVGVFASALLIMQYICYYVLNFHLKLVPTSLLLSESKAWVAGAETGLINIRGGYNGFYRPSAFFLEPSHLALFFFPIICLLLLSEKSEKWRIRCALLLTLGVVLSTSGIGIVCVVCIWLCYLAMYYDKRGDNKGSLKKLFSVRNILLVVSLIVLVVFLYFTVDAVTNTVNRFLFAEEGTSAIDGRVAQAILLVKKLRGSDLVFGLTDDASDIIFNLPGFFATLYKKGIIGIVLSYWFYGQGVFKLKGAYFWMSVIMLILSFFTAHTHGTFYMTFYVLFLVEGYRKIT